MRPIVNSMISFKNGNHDFSPSAMCDKEKHTTFSNDNEIHPPMKINDDEEHNIDKRDKNHNIDDKTRVYAFPSVFHETLCQADNEGYAHIASWQPHGLAFRIHKKQAFMDEVIIPHKVFSQSKWSSFQRQLNKYGFTRITKGSDADGYFHPNFIRDQPKLATKIVCLRVKGEKWRKRDKTADMTFTQFYENTTMNSSNSSNFSTRDDDTNASMDPWSDGRVSSTSQMVTDNSSEAKGSISTFSEQFSKINKNGKDTVCRILTDGLNMLQNTSMELGSIHVGHYCKEVSDDELCDFLQKLFGSQVKKRATC